MLTGALSLTVVRWLPGAPPLPRSIPLIFLLLALAVTAGPRFAVRLTSRSTLWKTANAQGNRQPPQPVLISA
jgi:hypothetical protein